MKNQVAKNGELSDNLTAGSARNEHVQIDHRFYYNDNNLKFAIFTYVIFGIKSNFFNYYKHIFILAS